MARTISEIKREITDWFIQHPTITELYGLNADRTFEQQFSVVSIESIIFHIVATCIWTHEKLFDAHVSEVTGIIDNKNPHSLRWYANIAKAFQFGHNLAPDTDRYDNEGLTDEEVEASRIIAHSAVVDAKKEGLLIKVAKENADDLAPLTDEELAAFEEYMTRVKDAGVFLQIRSKEADNLKLHLHIHYNPLVLNANGQRLDGTSLTPVADAVRAYLKDLPFNGLLALALLTDALQKIEGVVIPTIILAQTRYGDLNWLDVDIKYQPYAGYMRVSDDDLLITYEPQSEIL